MEKELNIPEGTEVTEPLKIYLNEIGQIPLLDAEEEKELGRRSVDGVVANVIFLFKESSVVSAIALADVMYMAKDLIGMYYSTYESLFMLVVAYLVILLPISIFGTWLERRFDYERR